MIVGFIILKSHFWPFLMAVAYTELNKVLTAGTLILMQAKSLTSHSGLVSANKTILSFDLRPSESGPSLRLFTLL